LRRPRGAPNVRAMRTRAPLVLVAGLSVVVFWLTAYPTITWWGSSEYSLAAATLGINGSPGSLLLTLFGWLATRISFGLSAVRELNLLAGVMAAATVVLVYLVALRVVRNDGESRGSAIGAALGALTFAFSATLWEHAGQYTPYVLTALFTGMLLLVMMRWWEDAERDDAWRWLALLGLLIGLDFSVHRTNSLLVPGIVAWILIRHPAALRRPVSWMASVAGLGVGLTMQLLVIPISIHTRSPLNAMEPTTWSRFWDYVSLAQLGGGFLVRIWPRNAAFWSVQVGDFLHALRDNFVLLPALAAMCGLVLLGRRNRRLAAAFTVVLALQAIVTVLYFNIPANFFRPLDRHYLPVFVTIGVLIAYAASALRGRVVALAAVLPAAQLAVNWKAHDASKRYFARDFSGDLLGTLPPRAVLFTVGDNDTFPLWYVQSVEGVRPDVRVVNLSLANAGWYLEQLRRRDPTLPLTERPMSVVGADRSAAVVQDMVKTNAERVALCFSLTAGRRIASEAPNARVDGLHACIAAPPDTGVDRDRLRTNLFHRYSYRGYADPSVRIYDATLSISRVYVDALDRLLAADAGDGNKARCADDLKKFYALMPPDRVLLGTQEREELEARCR
jgi:hypothetical protein